MSIFLLETPGLGRSGKDDMLGKRGCSPDIVDEEGVETDLPLSLGERSVAARKRTAFHKVTSTRILLHPFTNPCACRITDTQLNSTLGVQTSVTSVLTSLIISGVADLRRTLMPADTGSSEED